MVVCASPAVRGPHSYVGLNQLVLDLHYLLAELALYLTPRAEELLRAAMEKASAVFGKGRKQVGALLADTWFTDAVARTKVCCSTTSQTLYY